MVLAAQEAAVVTDQRQAWVVLPAELGLPVWRQMLPSGELAWVAVSAQA